MPANIIKNNMLRHHYTTATFSSSSSESESGSASGSAGIDTAPKKQKYGLINDEFDITRKEKEQWYADDYAFLEARKKARGRKKSF